MTARAHYGRMCTGPQHDPPGREGVLILRVWLEGRGDPKLRVRILGRLDVDLDDQDTAAAASIEETLGYVRGWLERFAATGRG